MGYKQTRKLYTLRWNEGQELHGLEVVTRGLSVENLLKLTRLASTVTGTQGVAEKTEEAGELFRTFARCLVSWNLEDDDGKPVPVTFEGIAGQDLRFVLDVVMTWMEAVASVDTPLPKPSGNGQPPGLEASLPMAPLSPSPAS